MNRKPFTTVLVLIAALIAGGCGADGPAQYHVSGEVTFHGKPVPAGVVRFLPDTTQGNQGPAGYASIDHGRYNTARAGRGTVGGVHNIVISGFDGQADPDGELEHGAPLFSDYHTTADLPMTTTTLDFDVR